MVGSHSLAYFSALSAGYLIFITPPSYYNFMTRRSEQRDPSDTTNPSTDTNTNTNTDTTQHRDLSQKHPTRRTLLQTGFTALVVGGSIGSVSDRATAQQQHPHAATQSGDFSPRQQAVSPPEQFTAPLWSTQFNTRVRTQTEDGALYLTQAGTVGSSAQLRSFDLQSGRERWSRTSHSLLSFLRSLERLDQRFSWQKGRRWLATKLLQGPGAGRLSIRARERLIFESHTRQTTSSYSLMGRKISHRTNS